ncbi:uncharacterized protein F5891DRAFT_994393 [Suillus fuscotomentosus]|uniref:Secreted protein n=1 Tax=Suillus fuscotomentosus TaxID=1912939 RepID=A0AAD4EM13_9AGAM|nr:uncharacterized protein F5891DRAFT_994393 [Suillus fuscotomentosus]KAG1908678.1 hypothetical protein F5891DRAFT_994393 [Suillus fuscotomentosus]
MLFVNIFWFARVLPTLLLLVHDIWTGSDLNPASYNYHIPDPELVRTEPVGTWCTYHFDLRCTGFYTYHRA